MAFKHAISMLIKTIAMYVQLIIREEKQNNFLKLEILKSFYEQRKQQAVKKKESSNQILYQVHEYSTAFGLAPTVM